KHVGDRVRGKLDAVAVENLAGLDAQHLAQRVLRQHQRAEQMDVGNLEDVAFVDAGGDVDVALVRADRDLRRVDVEVGVAAVEVVRGQLGQVARKFFAR